MPPHGPGVTGACHSHDPQFPDDNWNLYSMLDPTQTVALNVTRTDHVLGIFKPYVLRLSENPVIISDADAEIIIIARFVSPVHIRKFMVIGNGENQHHPNRMNCYVNHEGIDFTNISAYRIAESFNIPVNTEGTHELLISTPQNFNNITCLTIHFPSNHSNDEDVSTIIKYIGLQGEHTHYRREAVHANYEVLCSHQEIPPVNSATIEHY